jgi:hypothetical protein
VKVSTDERAKIIPMGQTKGHIEKRIDGMGKYEKCIQKRKTNVCMWSCNYQDVHQGRQGQTDTCKTQMKSKKVTGYVMPRREPSSYMSCKNHR